MQHPAVKPAAGFSYVREALSHAQPFSHMADESLLSGGMPQVQDESSKSSAITAGVIMFFSYIYFRKKR